MFAMCIMGGLSRGLFLVLNKVETALGFRAFAPRP